LEKDEKAGFKPSNHHKYRVFRFVVIIPYGHTNITILIESELVSDNEIARRAGHADPSTPKRLYGHVYSTMEKTATLAIEKALSKASAN